MFQDNLFRELVVDNFAGGGGASTGMEFALGYPVDIAINHDADAIAMHKVNHPYTRHFQEDVFAIDPVQVTGGRAVGIAWFSPDCKHFSRAKGGKPVEKKIRGLSWVIIKWAMSDVAPRIIFMENVPEIKTWGPLKEINGQMRPDPEHEGETFNGFIAMLTSGIGKEHPAFLEACEFLKIEPDSEDGGKLATGLGYEVSWKEFKACDYGAPTIRNRFYLIARRDGQPIVFPEPTHGKDRESYRTAAECIDWTIPCRSIFGRKKSLAENTLRRIAKGIDKFVIRNANPFIIQMNFENMPQDIRSPLSTITMVNKHYICVPSFIQYHSEQGKSEVRGQEINKPIMTIDGSPRYAINAVFLTKYFSGKHQCASVEKTLPTITSVDHNSITFAHIVKYYSGADQYSEIDKPLHTITTKDRHGLVESHLCVLRKNMDCKDLRDPLPTITTSPGHMAQINTYLHKVSNIQNFGNWTRVRDLLNMYAGYEIAEDEVLLFKINGELYFINDIRLRMLKAKELMLAQGFPSDYVIDIESYIGERYSEAKQIARMGNAVCPPVASALVKANYAECANTIITTMAMLKAVINSTIIKK